MDLIASRSMPMFLVTVRCFDSRFVTGLFFGTYLAQPPTSNALYAPTTTHTTMSDFEDSELELLGYLCHSSITPRSLHWRIHTLIEPPRPTESMNHSKRRNSPLHKSHTYALWLYRTIIISLRGGGRLVAPLVEAVQFLWTSRGSCRGLSKLTCVIDWPQGTIQQTLHDWNKHETCIKLCSFRFSIEMFEHIT